MAWQVEAVRTLQHHEAFRARTARLLLLQRHRPTLAKCYRAWRAETAKMVGARLHARGADGTGRWTLDPGPWALDPGP